MEFQIFHRFTAKRRSYKTTKHKKQQHVSPLKKKLYERSIADIGSYEQPKIHVPTSKNVHMDNNIVCVLQTHTGTHMAATAAESTLDDDDDDDVNG